MTRDSEATIVGKRFWITCCIVALLLTQAAGDDGPTKSVDEDAEELFKKYFSYAITDARESLVLTALKLVRDQGHADIVELLRVGGAKQWAL